MTQIAPDTVAKRIEEEDDDLLLLDIRPPDGYEEWHVPGSKNINVYEDLKSDLDSARTKLQDLPQNKEIVTVCAVGKMSATATDLLQEMGYEAKTMTDGMQGWGRVHNYAEIPTESGYLIQVARPGTGCLSYIVISRGEAMVIDPSQYIGKYQTILEYFNATLTAVTETHAHADHISGARKLANVYDVPYYLHHADIGTLDKPTLIGDGTELTLGDVTIEVIHTPGHTEGSVTFDIGEEALLTGDTLFLDSVGRPDLESAGQNEITDRAKTLYESLQELLAKQDDRWVLPAHDS
ncbi:MAG: MBL fold metallo-hydrolase, partial [Halobacteriaceae archaeon]